MPEPSAAVPPALLALWVGMVGACVGSFLNVVIARVPAGESVVRPGSRCPACRKPIRWYDNLPVISWAILRARCRDCGQPIPIRYPVVELLGAAAALGAFVHRGFTLEALAEFAFSSFLIALAAIDLDTWLLPHGLTLPLIALGLLASAAGVSPAPSLSSSAVGAAVGFGVFAAVAVVGRWVARREALGLGDVWLLCGLGAWLGAPALLPTILLASTQGALVGIALLLLGKAQTGVRPEDRPAPADGEDDWVPPRNAVPFGPFLALAALEWLYLAPTLAGWVPLLEAFR
jgi:leader peptidase (prepilin peptidase)/N-methyltransferase